MAIAERMLAARFNRPGHEVVNHRISGICSDGDMMEGVASEAASIAGHLGLGKLIVFYDDNHITIDGTTAICLDGEDVRRAYEAYGWHVQHVDGPEDTDALETRSRRPRRDGAAVVHRAAARTSPSGAPTRSDTAKAHGAPLGEEEVRATKEGIGWDPDKTFYVPTRRLRAHVAARARARQRTRVEAAPRRLARGAPRDGRRLGPRLGRQRCPDGWRERFPTFAAGETDRHALARGRRRWRASPSSRRR